MVGDERRIRTGSVLLWVAAALLGFALLSKGWVVGTTSSSTVGAGLWGLRTCSDDGCRNAELSSRGADDATWEMLGLATAGTTLASILGLLFLYVTAVKQRSATPLAARVVTIVLLLTMAAGIAFVVKVPVGFAASDSAGPGHAFTMFLVGILAALIAVGALWPGPEDDIARVGDT